MHSQFDNTKLMEALKMTIDHNFKLDDLAFAMINYDNVKRHRFTLIDLAVMENIILDTYTTDTELARLAMCSLSTIKRSINKLCEFGLITKHISNDNTKSLRLDQEMLELFLNTYFYKEPYYSEYIKQVGEFNGKRVSL